MIIPTYMPICMDRVASRLYMGLVGSVPGKRTKRTLVFNRDTAMPDMGLISRRAMTMGISHIW